MASNTTQTYSIPLNETRLNLNKLQTEVRNFDGFNKCNGIPYGGMLTPFQKSTRAVSGDMVIGADGAQYKIENNALVSQTEDNSVNIPLSNVYLQRKELLFKYLNYPTVLNVYLITSTLAAVCYSNTDGEVRTAICSVEDDSVLRPTGRAAYDPGGALNQGTYIDTRCFVQNNILYGVMLFKRGATISFIVFTDNGTTIQKQKIIVDVDANYTPTRTAINLVSGVLFCGAIDELDTSHVDAIKTIAVNVSPLERVGTAVYNYAPITGLPKFVRFNAHSYVPTEGFILIPLFWKASISGTTVSFTEVNYSVSGAVFTESPVRYNFVGDLVNAMYSDGKEHVFFTNQKGSTVLGYYGGWLFSQCATDDNGELLCGYKERLTSTDANSINVFALVNNGYISGISYGNTLLVDWNDVASDRQISVTNDNRICYASADGTYYIISPDTPKLRLIDNRYIVTNSIGSSRDSVYLAPAIAYDTLEHKVYSYATDWNNRFIGGEYQYVENSGVSGTYNEGVGERYKIASAVNPVYESTGNPFPGAIYNPQVTHEHFVVRYGYPTNFGANAEVDYFYGPATDVAVPYVATKTIKGTIVVNPLLTGTTYPTNTDGNIQYAPSLFNELITSYNNTSMIIVGKTAYPLTYYNNRPVYSYYLLSGVEGVEHAFSLQGGQYIVTHDQIFAARFNGGVVSVVDSVAYIKDFVYLGADQFKALFYCPFDRVIYAFTGDRLLREFAKSDKITEVFATGYNFHTQTIYLSTNDGVYLIYGNGISRIESEPVIKFFFPPKSVVMVREGELDEFSIVEDLDARLPLELETMFYGGGAEKNTIIDTWYIRLVNNDSESREIEVYIKALSDKGTATETKKIVLTNDMWDKETGTILIRYQPKLQRGVGVSFGYTGPFPIQSLTCSASIQTETTSSKVAI